MKHIFQILLLLALLSLHYIPYLALIHMKMYGWGFLYLPFIILDIVYGRWILMPYMKSTENEK